MDDYCNHSDYDDDKLLLDDENTNKINSCIECQHSRSLANGASTNHLSLIVGSGDCFSDTMDAPLLINNHYGEFENDNLQDFHCHAKPLLNEDEKALKKLVTVSVLCLLFMITEVIGGYLADSLAVMTDAAHLLSDLIGFFISILSIWIGRKSPTRMMTFGYHRAEVIGAFLSVIAVWLLAGTFVTLAIKRLMKGEYTIDADTMLIVASIGVIVNILMGIVLHSVCHGHSHGPQIQSSNENINVRAASAHVLGDLLQSVGVLIAAIVIKIFPNAKIADPICTLLFSVIVVYATVHVACDALKILAEASPKDATNFLTLFQNIPGVRHVHDVHIWSVSPGKDAIAAHLAVDHGCDRDFVLKQATSIARNRLNLISCTIQIEKYNEQLMDFCNQCQPY